MMKTKEELEINKEKAFLLQFEGDEYDVRKN